MLESLQEDFRYNGSTNLGFIISSIVLLWAELQQSCWEIFINKSQANPLRELNPTLNPNPCGHVFEFSYLHVTQLACFYTILASKSHLNSNNCLLLLDHLWVFMFANSTFKMFSLWYKSGVFKIFHSLEIWSGYKR